MSDEAKKPQNQNHNEDSPEHSFLWLSFCCFVRRPAGALKDFFRRARFQRRAGSCPNKSLVVRTEKHYKCFHFVVLLITYAFQYSPFPVCDPAPGHSRSRLCLRRHHCRKTVVAAAGREHDRDGRRLFFRFPRPDRDVAPAYPPSKPPP